ncbi:MAG: 2-oxo acid dehydrogenase subunit E2, partial [Dokdonella sp.]
MSTLHEVKVPDLGSTPDIPVIELLVKPGDTVSKDQGLVTLESDKATMEIPSTVAGVVKEILVKVGDGVNEGKVVAVIESSAAADAATAPTAGVAKAEPEKAVAAKSETKSETVSAPAPGKLPLQLSEIETAALTPDLDTQSTATAHRFDAATMMPDKVPHASPAVRVFARELGVDLAQLKGSERKGRISRKDVQDYVKQTLANPVAARSGSGGGLDLLPWPKVDFAKFGEIESKPLSRIKKISGANLARNWAMIPHVTQFDEADITELEVFRKQLGEEHKDTRVSPLVFQIKAVVSALKKFPNFNASLDADGESLILKKYFHVGIAVDTPDGLVVPVIRNCDQKGLLDLARELGDLSGRARDKKLGPAEMSGGCFSISSLGGIGGSG